MTTSRLMSLNQGKSSIAGKICHWSQATYLIGRILVCVTEHWTRKRKIWPHRKTSFCEAEKHTVK